MTRSEAIVALSEGVRHLGYKKIADSLLANREFFERGQYWASSTDRVWDSLEKAKRAGWAERFTESPEPGYHRRLGARVEAAAIALMAAGPKDEVKIGEMYYVWPG